MDCPIIHLLFHGNLPQLLPRGKRQTVLDYSLNRRATIKDIIESLRIPHTEIGAATRSNTPLPFNYLPRAGDALDIHPFTRQTPLFEPTPLRPQPLRTIAFMADDTVRKLERNLRIIGFDTVHTPLGRLTDVARSARLKQRIVVSRNRDLLSCRDITFGQLLVSVYHEEQLREVLNRYIRNPHIQLFSRCLVCNTLLQEVSKADIVHRLEPLTKKYYTIFKKCPDCDRIFWHGSHVDRMREIVNHLRKPHNG